MGLIGGSLYFVASLPWLASTRAEIVSRAFGSIFLGFMIELGCWFLLKSPLWWESQNERDRAFYKEWVLLSGGAVLVHAIALAAQWPCLMSDDALANYRWIHDGHFMEWSSWIYSAFLWMLSQFWDSPALVALVQVFSFSLLLGFILSRTVFYGAPKGIARASLAIFLAIPLNPALSLFMSRDVPFSWMQLGVACIVPFEFFGEFFDRRAKPEPTQRNDSLKKVWLFAGICAAFVKLRSESLIEIPGLVFSLILVAGWSWRKAAIFSSIFSSFLVLLVWVIPLCTGTAAESEVHEVTAMLNPLAEILRSPHWTDDPKRDVEVIDRVINYSYLSAMNDPYEIPAFHHGGIRKFSPEDFSRFRSLYLKLVIRNPGAYFKNRLRMLLATHGIAGPTFYVSDELVSRDPLLQESMALLGFRKNPLSIPLNRSTNQLLFESLRLREFWRFWLMSTGPALILSLATLIGFRKVPATAAAVFLVLIRIAAVSVTNPAAQFKYVYGLYLLGFVLPSLAYAELSVQDKITRDSI